MSGSTFYEILGIDADASTEDIRRAYRKRALETHPDRLPQGSSPEDKTAAGEAFRQVNNAYQILTDDNKRKLYDMYGVWPPPEELPNNSSRYRDPPRAFSGGSRHPGPFDYPFFTDPMFGHHPPPPPPPMFAFRDPFEVFRSFFPEDPIHQDHFEHFSDHPRGFFPGPPPMMFPSLFGLQSGFPSLLHHNHSRPNPSGQYFSFQSSSSSHHTLNGDDDQAPRWVSQSTSSRTVNGVTQVTDEKRDSRGNVHVRTVYPDGRVKYTINGIEHARPPARIPDVPPDDQYPARLESGIHGELQPSRVPEHRRKSERYRDSRSRRDSHASRDGYVPPPPSDSRPYIPPRTNSGRFSPRLDSGNDDDGYQNFVPASGANFPQDVSHKKWWKRQ